MKPKIAYLIDESHGWDEGTYGSSNPYIFFWTVDGQYIQWSGKYLYSDKPFRIEDPTIVILSK